MSEPVIIISIACLAGLSMVVAALLRGWQGWLELKRRELDGTSIPANSLSEPRDLENDTGSRIEVADLKERIRKLEAIASGVDL